VKLTQTFVRSITRGRVVALAALAATALSVPTHANNDDGRDDKRHDSQETIVFTIDVAEDFSLFSPTFVKPTDTQPERGSFFVTEGNVFPGGTIKGDGEKFDPNSDGSIGRWFCRGTHLVSGSEFPITARAVFTAQLYLFPDESKSIATDGVEGNGKVTRPITGGTGILKGYVGEQRQQFLGFNASGGVNLRVTFILKKATR
jgi:hypothetical protein